MRSGNFRILLQDEFEARCSRNPQYSLRAFAKAISMQGGALSEMMRGKRKITKTSIKKIGEKLRLSEKVINDFCEQYDRQDKLEKSNRRVEDIQLPAVVYDQMNLDEYHYLTEVIYNILLDIPKLKDFDGSIDYIAKKTGYDPIRIENAIERLERMQYLMRYKNGQWEDRREFVMLNIGKSVEAQKAFQKWIQESFRMAMKAAKENAPGDRVYNLTHTLPICSDDFDKLKKEFTAVTNRIDKKAAESKNKYDEIYEYHVSLYPLTK